MTKLTRLIVVSINDILVGLSIKESTYDEDSELYQEVFEFQKRFFKYVKPKYPTKRVFDSDSPDAEELLKKLRDNNDPQIILNRLRRLPIVVSYDVQFNDLNHIIVKHFLVLYNFFKTTLIAILLTVLYFIYTIFFFKLQFLKQLSV
jgi:hypothetical protein